MTEQPIKVSVVIPVSDRQELIERGATCDGGDGMFTHWPDFPPIGTDHLVDAELFANRDDMVCALPVRKQGKIAEVGVWQAAFSKVLVGKLEPRQFFAFDIFSGHLEADWNGMTGEQLFEGLTHRQYYETEMAPFHDLTTIVEGSSHDTLRRYGDRSFDLVYVDAAHHYDSVKVDAELAVEMVADSGFLLFDDYTLLDPSNAADYGIVPVVNDLVVNRGWRVVGYALNQYLYCTIALCRGGHAASRLTVERARSAQEKDRLRDERDRYESERDRYAQERDGFKDERDRYAQERDGFKDERDRYAQERDRCVQERDRYAQERDRCAQERDRYAEQNCVLHDEADRLRADLEAVRRSLSWRVTRPLRAIRARPSSS